VLSKLKRRTGIQTFYGLGLPDTGSLTGGGGSQVPSRNLDLGKVPPWQLWAVYDLNSSRCPSYGLPNNHNARTNSRQQQVLKKTLVLHSLKLYCTTLIPPDHLPLSQGSA